MIRRSRDVYKRQQQQHPADQPGPQGFIQQPAGDGQQKNGKKAGGRHDERQLLGRFSPVSYTHLKKVKRELIRYRESRKVHFKILEYDNPELLYYDVTDGNLSEVYILDVDMPKKNGLTLAETVHEKNPNAEVLILSAFPEYGVDAVNIGGIRRYVTQDLLGNTLF